MPKPYKTEDEPRQGVKWWGEKTVPDITLAICTQGRTGKADRWKQQFWCGSCAKCITATNRPTGHGWGGVATYDRHSRRIHIAHALNSMHGSFDRVTGCAQLKSTETNVVECNIAAGVSNTQPGTFQTS